MKTSRLNANIKKSTIKRQFLEKMFASKKNAINICYTYWKVIFQCLKHIIPNPPFCIFIFSFLSKKTLSHIHLTKFQVFIL